MSRPNSSPSRSKPLVSSCVRPRFADACPMAILANDCAVATMTARLPFPYSRERCGALHPRARRRSGATGNELSFAIADKADGAFLGCVG